MGAIHGHHGVMMGGTGAVDPFPQRIEVTETVFGTDTTSHSVLMPATVATGDLLLCFFASDGSATVTTPGGWTLLDSTANSTTVRGSWFYKIADGSEGGTNVDFVTSAAEVAMAQVHRFQNGTYTGNPQCSTAATGNDTAPNPPSFSPSFGAQNTFWIAAAASDNSNTPTGYPYGSGQLTTRSGSSGSGFTSAHTCFVNQNIGTQDPGAYTLSIGRFWVAHTVAVRGT